MGNWASKDKTKDIAVEKNDGDKNNGLINLDVSKIFKKIRIDCIALSVFKCLYNLLSCSLHWVPVITSSDISSFPIFSFTDRQR